MFFVRPTLIELFRLDLNNVDNNCVYDSSEDDVQDEEDERDVRDETVKVNEQKLSNNKLDVKITYTINLPEKHKTFEEISNFIVSQVYKHLLDCHCENGLVTLEKHFETR